MWDISWLLRRWPGAGFEDWGQALDALVERVRIHSESSGQLHFDRWAHDVAVRVVGIH
ncbi:MAG: cellulase-like family protein, partial [Candidatus Limnocylindrales bacterium]